MARNFSNTSVALELGFGLVTGPPFTISAWGRASSFTTNNCLFALEFNAANRYGIYTTATTGVFTYETRGSAASSILSTSAVSLNTWFHGLATEATTSSRRVRLNGGTAVTDTASRPFGSNPDDTRIGNGIGVNGSAGIDIAEVAFWNVVLTEDEEYALSRGYSPLFVRPQSLMAYWKLIGTQSPEPDFRNQFPLTVTGGPLQGTHAPIIYPQQPRYDGGELRF